jgi:Flp pilus assembly pilin Flp
MTTAFFAGALAGLGLFLLGLALYPPRPRLARRLAGFDAARRGANGHWAGAPEAEVTGPRWRLGSWLARLCAEQGWQFPSLRKNLSLAGLPFEIFLATKVLLAVLGLVLGPALGIAAGLAGFHVSAWIQVWLGLLLGTAFSFLPDLEVRQKANKRRRDFRHAIGSFLDLFAMNLAGGRGVPEALMTAAMWAPAGLLADPGRAAGARSTGRTLARAGHLGERRSDDELRDLSAAPPGRRGRGQGARVPGGPGGEPAPQRADRPGGTGGGAVPVDAGRAAHAVRRLPVVPGFPGGGTAGRLRHAANAKVREVGRHSMNSPVANYLRAFLGVHLVTLRAAWREQERGASAVELAVITAMILAVAVVLLAVITHFVKGAAKQIKSTTP